MRVHFSPDKGLHYMADNESVDNQEIGYYRNYWPFIFICAFIAVCLFTAAYNM